MVTDVTTTSAPPHCDAHAYGRAATDWGFSKLPCMTRVGLRTLVDQQGTTRYYCAAPDHEYDVRRRFGIAPDACYICRSAVYDGLYTRIDFGNLGVRNVCDNCSEKADEGQYVVMADES